MFRKTPNLQTIGPAVFKPPRGRKEIYLPNFMVTLTRTPDLPPTMANFIVPLNLNKLDFKDYLYNAYNIPCLAVRSYIKQQAVRQGKDGDKFFKPRRWYRPRAIKHMIVEMQEPFVWPAEPKGDELDKWDKTSHDAASEAQKKADEEKQQGGMALRTDGATIRKQAQALLDGKEKWKPSWVDFQVAGNERKSVNVRR